MDREETLPPNDNYKGEDRVTVLLVISAVSVAFGSLAQFGYQSGVINNPMDVIIGVFKNTTCSSPYPDHSPCSNGQSLYAIAIAMDAVGGLIGAFASGKTADTLGRKPTLLLNNVLAIGGSLMMVFSSGFSLLIAGRFIMGVNGGFNSSVASMYLSEIAPVRLRGVFGTVCQLGITTFIFLSQLFGLPELLGNRDLWRLLFGFSLVLATIQLLTLPFCPESPRYLFLEKHQELKAANVLRDLRGTNSIKTELDELNLELEKKANTPQVSYIQLFSDGTLQKPLIISFGFHLAQQLTGIEGVFYYSTAIFKHAGFSLGQAATYSYHIFHTTANDRCCMCSHLQGWLMDLSGRRSLMLYGLSGMMVFHLCLSVAFCFQVGFKYGNGITPPGVAAVISSILLVAFFAIGPGPVPWVIVPELFTQGPRAPAVSLAIVVNRIGNAVVGYTFPFILDNLYPYAMILFAGVSGVFWLFIYFLVRETKGKTIEEIAEQFRQSVNTPSQYARLASE